MRETMCRYKLKNSLMRKYVVEYYSPQLGQADYYGYDGMSNIYEHVSGSKDGEKNQRALMVYVQLRSNRSRATGEA